MFLIYYLYIVCNDFVCIQAGSLFIISFWYLHLCIQSSLFLQTYMIYSVSLKIRLFEEIFQVYVHPETATTGAFL